MVRSQKMRLVSCSDFRLNTYTSLLGLFSRVATSTKTFTHYPMLQPLLVKTSQYLPPQETHQTQLDGYRRRRQMSTFAGRASGSKSRRQVYCSSGYSVRNGSCYKDGLTGGEVGAIVIILVVLGLLLLAAVWWARRHRERVSRFMNKFRRTHEPKNKEVEGGTGGTKTTGLDSGSVGAGHAGHAVAELSPQERPQLLEEWGRHGSRGHELPGSHGAHVVSELDGNPVARK